MKKNQRKEIIEQIKDLSKSRKSVSIKNLTTNGISFLDDEGVVINPNDAGEETIIPWSVVSYYQENDGIPSEEQFQNLENLISPIITSNEIVSLNGLTDAGIDYQKNVRYVTRIQPNQTRSEYLTIEGDCWAALYIDDFLVLNHVNVPPGTVSRTSIKYPFNSTKEYKIELYIYGYIPSVHDGVINLSSPIFRYIKRAALPNIPAPLNVYASNNLPSTIRISWDQNPLAPLQGGGTEIFAKPTNVDTTYRFVDRVPYPTNVYMHTSQVGSQNILPNSDFQNIVLPSNDIGIPESITGDSTGLVGWGVSYLAGCHAFPVESNLQDYSTFVRFRTTIFDNNPLSNILDYDLLNNSDATNINSDPIAFNYTGTYFIRTDTSNVSSYITSAKLKFDWNFDPSATDAEVQCIVYKNGSPTTNTVPLTDGSYYYSLSAPELALFKANPAWLAAEFKTTAALAGSDPTTTLSFLENIKLEQRVSTIGLPGVILDSPIVSISPDSDYIVEIVYRSDLEPIAIAIGGTVYDTDGNYAGGINANPQYTETIQGNWIRRIVTLGSIPENTDTGKFTFTFIYSPNVSNIITFDVQRASVLKLSSRTLPASYSYDYKLRNYTQEMSYSTFTYPVTGSVSDSVYFLSLSSNEEYVSQFRSAEIYARATTPLDNISVHAEASGGLFVVPLYEKSSSSNRADYTFDYKPIFSVPVIYDTFDYDYRMNPNFPMPVYSITNNYKSAEESPARTSCTWAKSIDTQSDAFIIHANQQFPYYGFWPDNYPEIDNYKTYVRFNNHDSGLAKIYLTENLDKFYRNLFGNNDTEHGRFHHKDPKNRTNFSIGFIFRPQILPLIEPVILCRDPNLYSVRLVPLDPEPSQYRCRMEIYVKGFAYSGDPDAGSLLLRHDIVKSENNDWYYVHASADINNLRNNQRTYISVHNISNYPDHSVHNSIAEVYISEEQSQYWNWPNLSFTSLGLNNGNNRQAFRIDIDTFYLTADSIRRPVIDDVVADLLAESRNPYFSSFGYKTGQPIVIRGEGYPENEIDEDQIETEVPTDAGILTDEMSLVVDWNEPDGTMFILREAYTIDQVDIDTINDEQPLYTYSRINKLFVDMTSPYSELYKVRFSNDRTTWGRWNTFNNQILYPWSLKEIGEYNFDTSEGGLREVWCQVISETGNTSDPWLKRNHRDTIIYNPLASIGGISSYNYLKGDSGWAITLKGEAEFNDIWIRNNSFFDGRSLNGMGLNTGWLRAQIDPEYSPKMGFPRQELFPMLGDSAFTQQVTNRENNGFGLFGDIHDFIVDINNENIIYATAIVSSTYALLMRRNMETGNISTALLYHVRPNGYLYIPRLALDKDTLYVGYGTTIRSYDKETLAIKNTIFTPPINEVADLGWGQRVVTGGYISTIKLGISTNGTKKLYVFHGYDNQSGLGTERRTVTVIDVDSFTIDQKVVPEGASLNVPMEPGFSGTGSFDCNGVYASLILKSIEIGAEIRQFLLDENGLFVEVNVISPYVYQVSLYDVNNVIPGDTLPTSTQIFGEQAIYTTCGVFSIIDSGPSISSSSFASGNPGIHIPPSIRYVFPRNPEITPNQMALAYHNNYICSPVSLPEEYQVLKVSPAYNPYYGSFDPIIQNTRYGFGEGAVIGNTLLVPFHNSGHYVFSGKDMITTGSLIVGFDLMNGLAYKGVYSHYNSEFIQSLKYDGKYLWILSGEIDISDNVTYKYKSYIRRISM